MTEHIAILYSDGSLNVLSASARRSREKLLKEARSRCADDNFNVKKQADLARVILVEVTVKREIPEDEK